MTTLDTADHTLGIVGAGAMGQGIAQVAAAGGIRTILFDTGDGAAERGREAVAGRLRRLVEKGRMESDEAEAAIGRTEVAASLADLAPCDTVIEAVVEDIDVKRRVFADLEATVSADCILASNTSSIPIAAIAQGCAHRDRVAGMHFFNPVPLMKLVEVIRAAETSEATVEALTALGRRMTRVPVTVTDSPGFLVNMGGRAYTTEALRIVHEGVATPSQVDAVMRDCHGFRMGPFELMDLTGIDVNYPVSMIVYEGYLHDPRLRTAPNHRAMLDAGLLGRKTGTGWYRYTDGKAVDVPSPDHDFGDARPGPVTLADKEGPDADSLRTFCAEAGIDLAATDDGTMPLVAAPVGSDATGIVYASGTDHSRLVCLDLSGDTSKRITIMTAPGADPAIRDRAAATLAATGRAVTAITDSPGFVGQRIRAMIANLGCYMAEIGLASPEDIDTAMKLGLNYPLGPLEMADEMGLEDCVGILDVLQGLTGEDRYRTTLWLRRRAVLGLPVGTPR